jgi:hypothetical protein
VKKGKLIVIVLVVINIAILFSEHNKPKTKVENIYSNKSVYDFLENEENRNDVYGAAVKLNQGSSENTCVYFISEILRRNNFDIPMETSNTAQILSLLKEEGFTKQSNYKNLMPGDICFTTSESGSKEGTPSHTYIFMKWVKEGSYDYAYICDNQAKDYKGKVYHIRNIKVVDKANGFQKDAFAFFMKKA